MLAVKFWVLEWLQSNCGSSKCLQSKFGSSETAETYFANCNENRDLSIYIYIYIYIYICIYICIIKLPYYGLALRFALLKYCPFWFSTCCTQTLFQDCWSSTCCNQGYEKQLWSSTCCSQDCESFGLQPVAVKTVFWSSTCCSQGCESKPTFELATRFSRVSNWILNERCSQEPFDGYLPPWGFWSSTCCNQTLFQCCGASHRHLEFNENCNFRKGMLQNLEVPSHTFHTPEPRRALHWLEGIWISWQNLQKTIEDQWNNTFSHLTIANTFEKIIIQKNITPRRNLQRFSPQCNAFLLNVTLFSSKIEFLTESGLWKLQF